MAGQRVRRSVSPETAGAESQADRAGEGSAPGLLGLQQRIGNRATRALAHSHAAPPGTPPRPATRPSIRETAPMHPLQRAWVATSTSGQEQWDSVIGSKQWKRRAGSGGYEYYYSVTSGTMDVDNEMEWHGAEWYSERGVAVPPELLGTPSATAEPVVEDDDSDDEEEEWDVNALFDAVRREGLQGICNAMTAAYLLDFLDPSIDKVGMTELAFQKTALLKDLLDRVVTFYTDYDASDVTFAFVSWGQQKGLDSDWLAGLKDSNVTARFQEFRTYFHTARSALPARGGVTIAGKYADMNLEDVATKIDDMLEPWFSMSTNFQGVLVIKAQVEGASGMTGHELAFRYRGEAFEIFDQNLGLIHEIISEQEEIAEHLARHIMRYVSNPMPVMVETTRRTADSGRFEVQIHP